MATPEPAGPAPAHSRRKILVCAGAAVAAVAFVAALGIAFSQGLVTLPGLPDDADAYRRRAEFSVRSRLAEGETILRKDEIRDFPLEPGNPHGGSYNIKVFTRTKRPGQPDRIQLYRLLVERGFFSYRIASWDGPRDYPAEGLLK